MQVGDRAFMRTKDRIIRGVDRQTDRQTDRPAALPWIPSSLKCIACRASKQARSVKYPGQSLGTIGLQNERSAFGLQRLAALPR